MTLPAREILDNESPQAIRLTYHRDATVEQGEKRDAVRELFLEYAHALGQDLSFQHFEDELATLPGKYQRPQGCIILAKNDNQKDKDGWAGCIALRPMKEPGRCEMKRLYVRPAYRGLGIGETLVTLLLEEARAIGYGVMRLDTLETLKSAVKLYTGFGFKSIPAYYDNPIQNVIYMELQL